jgi:hypothetical protein
MKGWFGQKERHRQAALKGKAGGGRSMFYPGKGKYADIVSFKSRQDANIAAHMLVLEFADAKTRKKQVRVMRVSQLASNRAKASAKRLSGESKKKMLEIGGYYEAVSNAMQKELAGGKSRMITMARVNR